MKSCKCGRKIGNEEEACIPCTTLQFARWYVEGIEIDDHRLTDQDRRFLRHVRQQIKEENHISEKQYTWLEDLYRRTK